MFTHGQISRTKGHQSLHKLLQTVFTCKVDLLPASVILTKHEAGGMKQEGGQWCTQERGLWWIQSQSKDFFRLEIRELKGFSISTGPFFFISCDWIILLFMTTVIWSKWRWWFQRQGPFYVCCTLRDCGCCWSKRNGKRIGTSPIEHNGFILSTSFLLHLNGWENGQTKGREIPFWGGCSLRSEETQFYSDGAQYLDPLHQNASVQF